MVDVKYLTISSLDEISYAFHSADVAAVATATFIEGNGMPALIGRTHWQGHYNRAPGTGLPPAAIPRCPVTPCTLQPPDVPGKSFGSTP